MAIVELDRITKSYQELQRSVAVIRGVSLAVEPGEFVGLSGPSGSGKSTLLNILGLVLRADGGEHRFAGVDVARASDDLLRQLRRQRLSYVFQHFCLLAGLSALENIMVAALLSGASPKKARAEATTLLRRTGLEARADHRPALLSGGERQRVALCRALVHKPSLILADEPTGSLDSEAADRVLDLLREATRGGIAVVMASHSERALRACSRVLVLEAGVITTAEVR